MSLSRDQEALLSLLKSVRKFMDDRGITFYLFGGSCIGALRHEGFIPWDNDIDIAMDAENYQKLIEASHDMDDEDFDFCCYENNHDYFKVFGQFVSLRDTYFMKMDIFTKGLCMGTSIDVFVLDKVPVSRLREFKKDLLLYNEILGFYRLHQDELWDIKEEYLSLADRAAKEGRSRVIEELKSVIDKYAEEGQEGAVALAVRFWVGKFRWYRPEWWGKPRYCDFEGVSMPVPSHAEATLRYQYGYSWYMLPQEDGQLFHNFYSNHDISFNNYYEDLTQFIDFDSVADILIDRKAVQLERQHLKRECEAVREQLSLQKLLLELQPAIHSRNFAELEPLLDRLTCVRKETIPSKRMPEPVIAGWIYRLISEGRYYDAVRVSDAFIEGSDFENTFEDDLPEFRTDDINMSEAEGAYALLTLIVCLNVAFQDGNSEEMIRLLGIIPPEMHIQIPDCLKVRSRLLADGCPYREDETPEELLGSCRTYLTEHPDSYDIIKVTGDLLTALHCEAEAKSAYDIVLRNSRNGLDLLELHHRGFTVWNDPPASDRTEGEH